jgi:hypothetical protein
MEIKQPRTVRHVATTMDYSPLNGAITSSPYAKPQNGDGVITQHITGRVLFIENMRVGEESTNEGESMTYTDLVNLNKDKSTVLLVKHSGLKREDGAFLFDPIEVKNWGSEWKPCTIDEFRKRLNDWWEKGLDKTQKP